MSKSTVECTMHADPRRKKFSQVSNKQMDAEFDVGLLVQNSQSHPTFGFGYLINDYKKIPDETQNEHNDAKAFILMQKITKKCPKVR